MKTDEKYSKKSLKVKQKVKKAGHLVYVANRKNRKYRLEKKSNFSIFRKIDLIDFFDSIDSPIVEYIIEQFLLTSCLYHNNWF